MIDLAETTLFLAVESFTADAGRLLLRVAAMLFLAYLLTMGLILAAWSSRSARERLRLVRSGDPTVAVPHGAVPIVPQNPRVS